MKKGSTCHPSLPLVKSIQNPAKIVNGFQSLTIFAKNHHLRCWQDYKQHKNNLLDNKNGPQSINLIRKQLIMDRVHLIKRVSGGGIETWEENFQNDAHSRIESI